MQTNNNWGQPRSAGVKLGLIVRISLALLATVGSVALAWTLLSPHRNAAHAAGITELPAAHNPWGEVFDSTNNLVYVAEPGCALFPACTTAFVGSIGQYNSANDTLAASYTEPTAGGYSSPGFVALDGIGHVWFTEPTTAAIGELTPGTTPNWNQWSTGTTTTSLPRDLIFDGNGNIWFTDPKAHAIGFFSTSTHTTTFNKTPTQVNPSDPWGLVKDGSGNIWFSDNANLVLGEFTPATSGKVTIKEFSIGSATPAHLLAYDSKNQKIWYTEGATFSLGQFDPVATKYVKEVDISAAVCAPKVPPCSSFVSGISIDSAGRIWFEGRETNDVGYYDPVAGKSTTSVLPTTASNPEEGLVLDNSGNAWVGENGASQVAVVPPGAIIPGTPTPITSPTTGGTVTPTITPTGTPTPGSVPVSPIWYFAEGKVGQGFTEFVTVQNPDPVNACSVTFTYLLASGNPLTFTQTVTQASRFTESVNADLSTPASATTYQAVSTIVKVNAATTPNCKGVVAERPIYFTNFAGISSGTDVVGATKLGTTFYFADVPNMTSGSTGYNTFITILNPPAGLQPSTFIPNKKSPSNPSLAKIKTPTPTPTPSPTSTPTPTPTPTGTPVTPTPTPTGTPIVGTATVTVTYYVGGQIAGTSTMQVASGQRGTIIPQHFGSRVTAVVTSNVPVVVERPSYFTSMSEGNAGLVTGAASVVGSQSLSTDLLFAEGYTGGSFQENLVLSNPSTTAASGTVTLEYEGGHTQTVPFAVNANDVYVFNVNAYNSNPTGTCDVSPCAVTPNVSADVQSNTGIVAEREEFFSYNDNHGLLASGGSDVTGIATPLTGAYSFAEGYTNTGFDEWLTLQNPSASQETINVTLVNENGQTYVASFPVGPKSRFTVDITSLVKSTLAPPGSGTTYKNYEVSMLVQSAAGGVFVAERPMYFSANGWQGGTDVFGYNTNSN